MVITLAREHTQNGTRKTHQRPFKLALPTEVLPVEGEGGEKLPTISAERRAEGSVLARGSMEKQASTHM